ncbi:glycosyltransferase [Hyphomicrobium facile]|uniref:Glycosyltransferase involved in cell wall bisynthesis n=1 Tax=Hyphomicrobium facile TaxID=51670 RepID=A0A1I7NBV2_9HYPH|nr:glycosyltransferase [Hyphomicrobium facile]SFV32121.1 Glycosyltransferase involved in cell wall bisynthesis [Hyphomicrobium facile]
MGLSRFIRKFVGSRQTSEGPSFEVERLPELRGEPIKFGPIRVLSYRPPIFLSGIPYDEFLGMAPAFGRHYGDVEAGFIIFPTWSIETPQKAKAIRQSFLQHTKRYPRHKIRYICNTPGETRLLEKFGQPAMFLNHKFTVSERVFRPLPEASVEFDAIYNARFVAGKRHELAAEIERIAYLTYCEPEESRQQDFKRLWRETKARCPAHELLNEISNDLPVRVSHSEVNAALAWASTGLLLSEVEGASYAAVEYMLAGLSVVSTPSAGGRDAYFDPEYCIVCDATPRAVRDAVAELKSRNIPKSYIRDKTLKKLEPERQRFLALIDSLVEELGGQPQPAGVWPFGEISGVPWASFDMHLADFDQAAARRAAARAAS